MQLTQVSLDLSSNCWFLFVIICSVHGGRGVTLPKTFCTKRRFFRGIVKLMNVILMQLDKVVSIKLLKNKPFIVYYSSLNKGINLYIFSCNIF